MELTRRELVAAFLGSAVAASACRRQGPRELEAEAGGTSRSGRNAVSAYPWGAHYLPAPLEDKGPVVRLLREMGAVTGVDATDRSRVRPIVMERVIACK